MIIYRIPQGPPLCGKVPYLRLDFINVYTPDTPLKATYLIVYTRYGIVYTPFYHCVHNMKDITVRELRANLKLCLESLPTTITRNGEKVAVIYEYSPLKVYTNKGSDSKDVYTKVYLASDDTEWADKKDLIAYERELNGVEKVDQIEGKCGIKFCKYVGLVTKGIYTEWDYDNGEMVKIKAYMCPKHFNKSKNETNKS